VTCKRENPMSLLNQIDKSRAPRHVAIIMDGNGRWAKSQGRERTFGHYQGVESVRLALRAAKSSGVEFLTLYAFSTENWNRPKEEVDALMNLLVQSIIGELPELDENQVRLHAIGDLDKLPSECHSELKRAIAHTSTNNKLNLILALNYSARWEITHAVKQIVAEGIQPQDITDELFAKKLSTAGFPDPELLIRTSGEERISNFLLWQIAYAELYFVETLWPDFKEEDFYAAIVDFQSRERRFGKTSEQITGDALSPFTPNEP
jgi:undecaprenyl diphosphate synthase